MANDLKIKITADGAQEVEKNLKKVSSIFGDLDKNSKQAATAINNLKTAFDMKGMAAGAASVAVGALAAQLTGKAFSAVKNFGAEVLREADHFRKLSETMGISIEDVAGLDRAASQAGVSAESLSMAMQGVVGALDTDETSSQRKALEKLGVSLKDANGLYVDQKEALLRISDAFAKETDTTKKANIAKEAFGKSSKEMIPFLNQGREALEKQVKAYGDASGYNLDYAKNVEKLNSSLQEVEIAAKGALVAFSDSALFKAAIQGISDLSNSWVKFLGELKSKEVMAEFVKSNGQMEAAATRMVDLQNALNKARSEKASDKEINRLSAELEGAKNVYKWTRQQKELDRQAAAEKADADAKRKLANQQEDESAEKRKKNTEAARAATEAENKALDNWLANYQKSKMSETEIAQAAYDEQERQFNMLLTKNKITYDDFEKYIKAAADDLDVKIKLIDAGETKAFWAEIERQEKSTQEQLLRIREAVAKTDAERDEIALDRIEQKYKAELALAKENGIAIADVEKAKDAEIEAVEKQAVERRRAKIEYELQLRETAAATEEERVKLQIERMHAKYDAEAERAGQNAALLYQIESARIAEAERLENQLLQTKLSAAAQYTSAIGNVAKAAAHFGKAGGNTMKAIAVTEATINTYLAATKAMASAPWPMNLVLAAGATAAGMVQVSNIKAQKFARGGVVEGNSLFGDHVPVRANSGEMIFNKEQQRQLLEIANGRRNGGEQITINFAPEIPQGSNATDIKKFFRENQPWFNSMLANSISKGLTSAGVFA